MTTLCNGYEIPACAGMTGGGGRFPARAARGAAPAPPARVLGYADDPQTLAAALARGPS